MLPQACCNYIGAVNTCRKQIEGVSFQLDKHWKVQQPSESFGHRSPSDRITHRRTVSKCAFNAFRNDAAAVKYEVAVRLKPVMMKQNPLRHRTALWFAV